MSAEQPQISTQGAPNYTSPSLPAIGVAITAFLALCLHLHLYYLWLNWQYTITSLEPTIQAILWLVLNGMTSLFYFIWLKRVSSNLKGFSIRQIKHTPMQACYWHVVPFVNLFLPYLAVIEISDVSIKRKRYMEMVTTWWISWLIFALTILLQFKGFKDNIENVIVYLNMVSGIVLYPALIYLVLRINAGQKRRRENYLLHNQEVPEEEQPVAPAEMRTIGKLRERSR